MLYSLPELPGTKSTRTTCELRDDLTISKASDWGVTYGLYKAGVETVFIVV